MTDSEFHDEGPEDPEKILEKYQELFRSKIEEVEDGARKVGLYMREGGMTLGPDFETQSLQPVMVLNFSVGDVAWSDRVQNPAQDTTESEFKKMAVQMEKDKFEEMREEMERRLREGKGVFEEGEDDEEG